MKLALTKLHGFGAVAEWIGKVQPLASFHGHIHENYQLEGAYIAQVGSTLCVQPGQMQPQGKLVYVIGKLEGGKIFVERREELVAI